mgnify:CR=1 FL=1
MSCLFLVDDLSKFIGFFVILFTLLIFVYSLFYIKKNRFSYYLWFFLTSFVSLLAVFSNHIFLLLIFWGFLALTLFKLINFYSQDKVAAVAKKTFIIVGGTDSFLLLGFVLYLYLNSSVYLVGEPLVLHNGLSFLAFFLIASACFAKAGCFPFHSWVVDTAEYAPIPVVACLPASLDKLLGIYLLARITKNTFLLNNFACGVLLFLGAVTIVGAVMMALVQHNVKRLLGFHAVSQVGYMVLGMGCNSPLGLAAGLFHMVNNAIYKSCLFLGAGNVEERMGTLELKDLGGLYKFMPLTFIAMLIAAFSISGIPPFNGFVSKWMIYQGLIDFMNNVNSLGMKIILSFSLVCALIGSSLTLASFLKLIGGIFMGKERKKVEEVSFAMYFPPLFLSLLCIVLGFFSVPLVFHHLRSFTGIFSLIGIWKPVMATNFILIGIILGWIIFSIFSKIRITERYVGGEMVEEEVKTEDFYTIIRDLNPLKNVYNNAEKGRFDLYEQGKNLTFLFTKFLSYLHNGVLPTYLVWCLLGVMGLILVFFK